MNTLHLVVTTLCDRNCAWCCNRQYDIKNLEYVTEADLRWAEMLCLTGGEPFEYANPCRRFRCGYGGY
jgi:organic radical activating enzyme